jgi:hypothetical protein
MVDGNAGDPKLPGTAYVLGTGCIPYMGGGVPYIGGGALYIGGGVP